jgi:hypothetical protein
MASSVPDFIKLENKIIPNEEDEIIKIDDF